MSDVSKTVTGNQYLAKHKVGNQSDGIRLDRFLMLRYRRRSREQLKRAIDSGAITVTRAGAHQQNLGKMKPSFVLQQGDLVHVLSTRRPEPEVSFDYKILFEDEHIIVVDKPAGLPVHPAGKYFFHTLLIHMKTNGFQNKGRENERPLFLVHRLDKDTSGVMVMTKTSKACAALTLQFFNRETEKYYLALVHGTPPSKEFSVDAAITKVKGSPVGLKMYSVPAEQGGYASFTHFKVLETRGKFSLIACYPKTGRQHQIRVHAEIAGYPLVGDKIYGLSDEDALILIDGHRVRTLAAESGQKETEEPVLDLSDEVPPLDEVIDDEEFPEEEIALPAPRASNISPELYAKTLAKLLLPRHALHAAGLKFTHPVTGKVMNIESDLAPDLKAFFDSLPIKI